MLRTARRPFARSDRIDLKMGRLGGDRGGVSSRSRLLTTATIFAVLVRSARADAQVFYAGDIVGAILGTFFATLGVTLSIFLPLWFCRRGSGVCLPSDKAEEGN